MYVKSPVIISNMDIGGGVDKLLTYINYKLIPIHTGRKEMFYLTMHLTHFIYSYIASDIW